MGTSSGTRGSAERAAVLVAVGIILTMALAACAQGEGKPDPSEQAGSADVHLDVGIDDDPVGKVLAENVSGLDRTTLDEGQKRFLLDGLTNTFKSEGDMSQAKFEVSEQKGGKGYRHLTILDKQTSKKYNLYLGSNWNLEEIADRPEKSAPGAQASSAATPAPAAEEHVNRQDQHSKYNSSKTEFDVGGAWPLSMRDKVDGLIGAPVAERLLADLNEYMSAGDIEVSDPVNVLVSEKGIEKAGNIVKFTVMAYHENDRIVMKCEYDVGTLEHGFTWME